MKGQGSGGLGADHHRLHPADARRGHARQPGRAGRSDEPRAEDPRPRAQGAGDRPLAALARARAAHRPRQAPDPLRPARVRQPGAGRRPGRVHLPRGLLQELRRGGRRRGGAGEARGDRRADRPQEPQRADRHGPARVHREVRVVPDPRALRLRRPGRRRRRDAAAGRRGRRDERSGRETAPVVPARASATAAAGSSRTTSTARACECRERRIAQARTRGRAHGAAAEVPGRRLRPPADLRHGPRPADAGWCSSAVRGYIDELGTNDRRGPRAVARGRRRHRQDDPRDARLEAARSRPATRSRSTRCRGCWRGSAAPTTATPAELSYLEFFGG